MNYLICSTQRSGSSYFCHLLKDTSLLGRPTELFGKKGACEKIAKKYNILSENDVFAGPTNYEVAVAKYIKKKWTSKETGVFGLKMHFHQYMRFLENEELKKVIGDFCYIYIDRVDVVSQAVSLFKARMSGAWSSKHVESGEVEYSYEGIYDALLFLSEEKAKWESFFSSIDKSPLRVHYEALEENPEVEVARVAQYLDIAQPVKAGVGELYLSKQRDETSEKFRERFIFDSKRRVLQMGSY